MKSLSDQLSKQGNYIPYQVCPVCGGTGMIQIPSNPSSTANVGVFSCDVCDGKKIIPMHHYTPIINPKRNTFSNVVVLIILTALLLLGYLGFIGYKGFIKSQDDVNQKLDTFIKQDSLRTEHYSQCSFISIDDIGTGYDGYLYNKDWRRRHGREPK